MVRPLPLGRVPFTRERSQTLRYLSRLRRASLRKVILESRSIVAESHRLCARGRAMAATTMGFLYTSKLSPKSDPTAVANITRDARGRNALDGISGVLVFDGECFAQFVEGPAPAVTALHERIARDKRHVDVLTLWHGAVDGTRRFPNWRLGYLLIDEPGGEELSSLRALRGDAAIDAFCRLTSRLDLESGFADTVRPADLS